VLNDRFFDSGRAGSPLAFYPRPAAGNLRFVRRLVINGRAHGTGRTTDMSFCTMREILGNRPSNSESTPDPGAPKAHSFHQDRWVDRSGHLELRIVQAPKAATLRHQPCIAPGRRRTRTLPGVVPNAGTADTAAIFRQRGTVHLNAAAGPLSVPERLPDAVLRPPKITSPCEQYSGPRAAGSSRTASTRHWSSPSGRPVISAAAHTSGELCPRCPRIPLSSHRHPPLEAKVSPSRQVNPRYGIHVQAGFDAPLARCPAAEPP